MIYSDNNQIIVSGILIYSNNRIELRWRVLRGLIFIRYLSVFSIDNKSHFKGITPLRKFNLTLSRFSLSLKPFSLSWNLFLKNENTGKYLHYFHIYSHISAWRWIIESHDDDDDMSKQEVNPKYVLIDDMILSP